MKTIKFYSLLVFVTLLSACSYFQAEKPSPDDKDVFPKFSDIINPRSWNISPYGEKTDIERLVYQETKGDVELYKPDGDAEMMVETQPMDADTASGIHMQDGVQIFPLDQAMEKTLNPVQ